MVDVKVVRVVAFVRRSLSHCTATGLSVPFADKFDLFDFSQTVFNTFLFLWSTTSLLLCRRRSFVKIEAMKNSRFISDERLLTFFTYKTYIVFAFALTRSTPLCHAGVIIRLHRCVAKVILLSTSLIAQILLSLPKFL